MQVKITEVKELIGGDLAGHQPEKKDQHLKKLTSQALGSTWSIRLWRVTDGFEAGLEKSLWQKHGEWSGRPQIQAWATCKKVLIQEDIMRLWSLEGSASVDGEKEMYSWKTFMRESGQDLVTERIVRLTPSYSLSNLQVFAEVWDSRQRRLTWRWWGKPITQVQWMLLLLHASFGLVCIIHSSCNSSETKPQLCTETSIPLGVLSHYTMHVYNNPNQRSPRRQVNL